MALIAECYPEIALGPLPQLYPFIVNDPGEGTQAKRRTSAVIIDHLTPPLTRAETYGPLKDLEALLDEYYLASGLDRRRLAALKTRHPRSHPQPRLDLDAGFTGDDDSDLHEARRLSLRSQGSADPRRPAHPRHVARRARSRPTCWWRSPACRAALAKAAISRSSARWPRILALTDFDPLACDMADRWTGAKPVALLQAREFDPGARNGDTVERLEACAQALLMPAKRKPGPIVQYNELGPASAALTRRM